MGDEEKRLPFSIISKGKKIKELKKLGWKGYLLVITFFLILGGVVAYYQFAYQTNQSNQFSSKIEKRDTVKEDLTLDSVSQPELKTKETSKEEFKLSQTTITKQENEGVEQQVEDINSKQAEKKESMPQMSSETVTTQFNNLIMPLQGKITSNREWYKDEVLDAWKYNPGINIKAEIGSEVKAVQKGTIEEVIKDDYQGVTIIIKHNKLYKTIYSNLEKSTVKVGEEIKQGQIIANLGDSGLSTDMSKLHFEIIKEDKTVAPLDYVKGN